jgi:hypothetical protein
VASVRRGEGRCWQDGKKSCFLITVGTGLGTLLVQYYRPRLVSRTDGQIITFFAMSVRQYSQPSDGSASSGSERRNHLLVIQKQ